MGEYEGIYTLAKPVIPVQTGIQKRCSTVAFNRAVVA
jgi:hypothetical protein